MLKKIGRRETGVDPPLTLEVKATISLEKHLLARLTDQELASSWKLFALV